MAKIYLTSPGHKTKLLQELRKSSTLEDIKVMSLHDLMKVYPFSYQTNAIDYIMETYHVIFDIASIYLEQIILYDIDSLQDSKSTFLKKMKQDLYERKLLVDNKLFIHFMKSSEIFCDLPKSKTLSAYLKDFQVTYLEEEIQNYTPSIYELTTPEEEVAFVGEKIVELLKSGVDISSIYLCNLDLKTRALVKKIFFLQQIPVNLKEDTMLSMTPLGSKFLFYLQDMEAQSCLERLQEEGIHPEDMDVYVQIVNTVHSYLGLINSKAFIEAELKQKKIGKESLEHAVQEISFDEMKGLDDAYVFLINATSKTIPKTYKDEDYLSDESKKLLGVDTSEDHNIQEKETMKKIINNTPHLVITYPMESEGKENYPSAILDDYKEQVHKGNSLSFQASHLYNQIYLAQELDEYHKYNTLSNELLFLEKNYALDYASYDPSFSGIPYNTKNVYLSYSTLDTYQKCPFRYYVTSVLKIKKKEETFPLFVGNLFHKILEKYYQGFHDWESLYEEEIQKHSWSSKEKFFLSKLKKDLSFLLRTLEEQDKYSQLQDVSVEEKIITNLDSNVHITFQGKIDKIKSLDYQGKPLLVLIDYKTGNTSMKKEYMPLGFHLQLPIYLYLISEKEKNAVIGGIYLQTILPSRIIDDGKGSLEQKKKHALKYQGYSNSSFEILEMVDQSYLDSHVIAGLKVKQDMNFYAISKVLNDEDMNVLSTLAKERIIQTGNHIAQGHFEIAPKVIDQKEHISCEFCSYKDLCYHRPKDDVYVQSDSTFLRKEGA